MEIDHLFVFSRNGGKEADELLEFGFVEGSNRVHVGQGTANRKFYFENSFLELLWVVDEREVKSKIVAPTKLWERAHFNLNQSSPFGLCLDNTDDTDSLFVTSIKYQPLYFPTGQAIDVITNELCMDLPWTFRLPFKGSKKKVDEPTRHRYGIKRLTTTEFIVPPSSCTEQYTSYFRDEKYIIFTHGDDCQLILTFDNHKNKKSHQFKSLPVAIKY